MQFKCDPYQCILVSRSAVSVHPCQYISGVSAFLSVHQQCQHIDSVCEFLSVYQGCQCEDPQLHQGRIQTDPIVVIVALILPIFYAYLPGAHRFFFSRGEGRDTPSFSPRSVSTLVHEQTLFGCVVKIHETKWNKLWCHSRLGIQGRRLSHITCRACHICRSEKIDLLYLRERQAEHAVRCDHQKWGKGNDHGLELSRFALSSAVPNANHHLWDSTTTTRHPLVLQKESDDTPTKYLLV